MSPDTPSRDDLAALRAIAEGTARHTGQEFFQSLVRHLASAVGTRYAFVAEFAGGTRARTLAFWFRDRVTDNLEWDVVGTPCEDVVRGNLCHHPAGVSQRFPEDKLLVDWASRATWACRSATQRGGISATWRSLTSGRCPLSPAIC